MPRTHNHRPGWAEVDEDSPVPDDQYDFSAIEAAAYSGLSYRQLDYLVSKGRIEPANEAVGSGSRRRFRRSQVLALRALGRLRRAGIGTWPDMFALERVIHQGGKCVWILPDGEVLWGRDPSFTEPAVFLQLGDPQVLQPA